MQYGICKLGIVPVRILPNDESEMVTQLIYGDHFEIITIHKNWLQIRIAFDHYEGWIDQKQVHVIDALAFNEVDNQVFDCSADLIEYVQLKDHSLMAIPLGSCLAGQKIFQHQFEGHKNKSLIDQKKNIPETAAMYLNSPYMWGGKTPFGIDCSGLTQMVYRLHGYVLPRDASQQAKEGDALSFIEESEPGDLAFFDNDEGRIIHVGIMLKDNYIIHAHGYVRIDRIDHTGIFNVETKTYSHQLRVIKKII
ncbi:C40 family peptidase [Psychroflexus maritimus]|uniref:C40 family peptidase n=1 Tax=Psychroflexus maritimus TaxID=2714865 RepID=A0A967ACQ8_9FLAO|nr:C40 family peptidase [Psychroflexus maritimus]NGZ88888.1 C40 family peptidase [Psychroflexus maritimus]